MINWVKMSERKPTSTECLLIWVESEKVGLEGVFTGYLMTRRKGVDVDGVGILPESDIEYWAEITHPENK